MRGPCALLIEASRPTRVISIEIYGETAPAGIADNLLLPADIDAELDRLRRSRQ